MLRLWERCKKSWWEDWWWTGYRCHAEKIVFYNANLLKDLFPKTTELTLCFTIIILVIQESLSRSGLDRKKLLVWEMKGAKFKPVSIWMDLRAVRTLWSCDNWLFRMKKYKSKFHKTEQNEQNRSRLTLRSDQGGGAGEGCKTSLEAIWWGCWKVYFRVFSFAIQIITWER